MEKPVESGVRRTVDVDGLLVELGVLEDGRQAVDGGVGGEHALVAAPGVVIVRQRVDLIHDLELVDGQQVVDAQPSFVPLPRESVPVSLCAFMDGSPSPCQVLVGPRRSVGTGQQGGRALAGQQGKVRRGGAGRAAASTALENCGCGQYRRIMRWKGPAGTGSQFDVPSAGSSCCREIVRVPSSPRASPGVLSPIA